MHKIAILILGLTFASCGSDTNTVTSQKVEEKVVKQNYRNKDGKKEGKYVSKSPTGVVQTEISYKNGIREGESLEYYDSGKLRARVNYSKGKKHGKAYWYFDGEQPFRINTYNMDIRDGLQEKFYRDGTKLSQLEFRNEYPGIGLREWKENGRERQLGNTIKAFKRGNTVHIEMSSGQSNVQFYYGELVENKFLNSNLREITGANGKAQLNLNKIKDRENIVISARYKTYLKNDRVVSETFKWSEL